jgi:hypothetical protein
VVPNKAFIDNDGIICQQYQGDQDGATAQDMVAQTVLLIEQTTALRRAVRILIDLHAIGRVSLRARQTASRALQEWPYERIAAFGASLYIRTLGNLIVSATKKGDKVRFFPTEKLARKWLNES